MAEAEFEHQKPIRNTKCTSPLNRKVDTQQITDEHEIKRECFFSQELDLMLVEHQTFVRNTKSIIYEKL